MSRPIYYFPDGNRVLAVYDLRSFGCFLAYDVLKEISPFCNFFHFSVAMLCLGLKDPFAPIQNLICTIFFGGVVDALKTAMTRQQSDELSDSAGGSSAGAITPNTGVGISRDGYGGGSASAAVKEGSGVSPLRRTNSPNSAANADKKRD